MIGDGIARRTCCLLAGLRIKLALLPRPIATIARGTSILLLGAIQYSGSIFDRKHRLFARFGGSRIFGDLLGPLHLFGCLCRLRRHGCSRAIRLLVSSLTSLLVRRWLAWLDWLLLRLIGLRLSRLEGWLRLICLTRLICRLAGLSLVSLLTRWFHSRLRLLCLLAVICSRWRLAIRCLLGILLARRLGWLTTICLRGLRRLAARLLGLRFGLPGLLRVLLWRTWLSGRGIASFIGFLRRQRLCAIRLSRLLRLSARLLCLLLWLLGLLRIGLGCARLGRRFGTLLLLRLHLFRLLLTTLRWLLAPILIGLLFSTLRTLAFGLFGLFTLTGWLLLFRLTRILLLPTFWRLLTAALIGLLPAPLRTLAIRLRLLALRFLPALSGLAIFGNDLLLYPNDAGRSCCNRCDIKPQRQCADRLDHQWQGQDGGCHTGKQSGFYRHGKFLLLCFVPIVHLCLCGRTLAASQLHLPEICSLRGKAAEVGMIGT